MEEETNLEAVISERDRKSLDKIIEDTSLLVELDERSQRLMKPTLTMLCYLSIIIGLTNLGFIHNILLQVMLAILNTSAVITALEIYFRRKSRLVNWLAVRELAISYGIIGKYNIPVDTNYLKCIVKGYRRARYGLSGPKTLFGQKRIDTYTLQLSPEYIESLNIQCNSHSDESNR